MPRFSILLLGCSLLIFLSTAASAAVLFEEDFADNAAGWSLQGEWEIGAATAGGGDPTTDHTPTADNGIAGTTIGGSIGAVVHSLEYITSPIVDTTVTANDVELQFFRVLRIDHSSFMGASVEVYDGSAWQVLWNNTGIGLIDDPDWTQQIFDVTPYKNAAMQVRFGLSTTLFTYNFPGWSLDDVSFVTVNTAPVLSPTTATLTDVEEDAAMPNGAVGTAVSDIVGYVGQPGPQNVDDVGPGLGIAVTNIGLNLQAYYTLDDGATWDAFPVVDTFSALLLPAAPGARLFLQPLQAEWSGTVSNALIFRAWDRDVGLPGAQANTQMNGGTTPFSQALGYADLDVTPVNDPPILDLNGPNPGLDTAGGYAEDQPPTTFLSPIMALVDPDNANMWQATARIVNVQQPGLERLSAVPVGGIQGSWDGAQATYTFDGSTTIANYLTSLQTLAFHIDSQAPDATPRQIEVRINDGVDWSMSAFVTITVQPVNDLPYVTPFARVDGDVTNGFTTTVYLNEPVQYTGFTLEDYESDTLVVSFSASPLPVGVEYTNWPMVPTASPIQASLTGTPTEPLDLGQHLYIFTVTDGQGGVMGFTLQVTVAEKPKDDGDSTIGCCGFTTANTSLGSVLWLLLVVLILIPFSRRR